MGRMRRRVQLIEVLVALLAGATNATADSPATERVSLTWQGGQIEGGSRANAVSPDARFVTFMSGAGNVVEGDTNGFEDVFIRDRLLGLTERVSVATDGTEGNWHSGWSVVSADGRFVAFSSFASNLVPGDTNDDYDVFLRDRLAVTTERINLGPGGVQANDTSSTVAISADGRYVLFNSYATNLVPGGIPWAGHVYLFDRHTGLTEVVDRSPDGSLANDSGGGTGISADGRFVAFDSRADNLVPGDTNSSSDVFVRDRDTGVTERVSLSSGGVQGDDNSYSSSLSPDGRFVTIVASATNLVPGDTNGFMDTFVHDRFTGVTERYSLSSSGDQPNQDCFGEGVSSDGARVALSTFADNLSPADPYGFEDVFLRDQPTARTSPVSLTLDGGPVDGHSNDGEVTADGTWVLFYSEATNLVADDTNASGDVFLRGPHTSEIFSDDFESGTTAAWSDTLP